jgi:hypothetical protein
MCALNYTGHAEKETESYFKDAVLAFGTLRRITRLTDSKCTKQNKPNYVVVSVHFFFFSLALRPLQGLCLPYDAGPFRSIFCYEPPGVSALAGMYPNAHVQVITFP